MPNIQYATEEANQVDAFIDTLLRDPKAIAPVGLSPELADFIRTLVNAEQVHVAHDLQARVWRKAYLAAQVQRLQQPTITTTRGTVMTTSPMTLTPRRVSLTNNLTLIAAAAAVIVLVAGMVAYSTIKPPPPSTAFGSVGQVTTPTPELTASPSHTPTQSGVITQPIELTATAIIDAATATSAAQQTANALVDPNATSSPFPTFTETFTPVPFEPTVVPPFEIVTTATPITAVVNPIIPPEAYEKALRVPLNNMLVGGITPEQPYVIYEFEAPQDGMMDIYAVTADFPISLSYQYVDAANGGGGGGGGGGGEPLPRSAEIVVFVKKTSLVRVVVSSADGTQFGQFNLGFYFDTGRILTDLAQPINGSFDAAGSHFRYYLFTGKAGTRLDLVASEIRGAAMPTSLDLTMMLLEVQTTMGGTVFSVGASNSSCTTYNGPLFCIDDNSGAGSNPELSNVVVRADTLYAIILRSAPMGEVGAFSLSISEHEPIAIDQSAQPITLDSQHRQNVVVFNGQAGKTYDLSTQLKITPAVGRLTAPIMVLQNGYLLATMTAMITNTTQQIIPITDGPVVVIVSYPSDLQGYVIPATVTLSLSPIPPQ